MGLLSGLPLRPVLILLFVAFGDVIMDVMLYPILPYLVKDAGIEGDHVGLYVGQRICL